MIFFNVFIDYLFLSKYFQSRENIIYRIVYFIMAEEIKSFIQEGFDPETCSIEELEAEVNRMKDLEDFYESKQLGEKLFLNSMYGAVSSKYFVGYNLEVSKSITLQGQDLNHFSENCVNKYFSGVFQNDVELHKKLGIRTEDAQKVVIGKGRLTVKNEYYTEEYKQKNNLTHLVGNQTLTVAGDTDSIYVEFGRIVNQLNIPDEQQTEFVVALWNEGCGPFMEKCYDAYAKHYNCKENLEVLELEKVCRTTILYAKKHYAMEEIWEEPGVFLPEMQNIIYKGLEVIQGSTPPYARKCQKEMIEYVLGCYAHSNERPKLDDLIDMLKKFRREMEIQDIETIAKGTSLSDYEKFILEDKKNVVIGAHCPIHVNAAAWYNHKLLNNKKYLMRYSRIKSKDKVKWYYCQKSGDMGAFAFLPNNYPIEFAPKIDYDEQFKKTIFEPLNRLLCILGYTNVPSNLATSEELW